MAKKIQGYVRLQLPAGAANPAPPVGPALGAQGVNIMGFCKEFNAKTKDQNGMIIPVVIKPFYFVKDAAGVIGFVGGDHPAPLRQAEIDEIKTRLQAATGKEIPKVTFDVGEEVKITDGPFMNLNGRIDEVDPARGKLKISVSIFGRFTPVELEYWQVQRASES